LTVVASDKDGNPVKDLKEEDFTVLDNGKNRSISLWRYERGHESSEVKAPELPPFVFSNRHEAVSTYSRNITALVLDSVNTEPQDQIFVKGQASRLLRALAPQTRVAIYQLGRELRIIHDYTDEMSSLRDNLETLKAEVQAQGLSDVEQAAKETEALLDQIEARKTPYAAPVFASVQGASNTSIAADVNSNSIIRGNRVESTLAALEGLGRHLAGIPGRKSVVWISGGIPVVLPRVTTISDNKPINPITGDNLSKAIRNTSERLAQAGVALYAIDARGLKSGAESLSQLQYPPLISGRVSELEKAAIQNTEGRAAFAMMTSITGGRFVFGTNDLSEGVRKVAGDLNGSYSLGFYAPEDPDNKWHTLKVIVRRPGVRLLHKEGYLADASPIKMQAWNAEAERRAMTNPYGSDSIHLTARCESVAGTDPGTLLLTLQIEADDLYWREESDRLVGGVDVYIGEKTSAGSVTFQQSRINARFLPRQMESVRSQGLPFRRQWKCADDTRLIRVLVRDSATGRIGTVDMPMSGILGNRPPG
jgi:VWFA-related protein